MVQLQCQWLCTSKYCSKHSLDLCLQINKWWPAEGCRACSCSRPGGYGELAATPVPIFPVFPPHGRWSLLVSRLCSTVVQVMAAGGDGDTPCWENTVCYLTVNFYYSLSNQNLKLVSIIFRENPKHCYAKA